MLREWVNVQSKCEESFTALHFASFFGNLTLAVYLIGVGADPFSTNKCDINMLHVAAQGDQPRSLAFFLRQGLDINSRDKRMSTPLHWAAFAGSEMALNYILAWGGDFDAQDVKGLTPLFLAIKASEEIRSTQSVRALLYKGASIKIRNSEGHLPISLLADFDLS